MSIEPKSDELDANSVESELRKSDENKAYEPPQIVVHSAEKLKESCLTVSACSPYSLSSMDQWAGG